MPYEDRGNWPWDEVSIFGPCITWEDCFECLYQEVFIWKMGKEKGRANICPDCGSLMYTIVVVVCNN